MNNTNKDKRPVDYKSFLLLNEISENNEVTQRDLSKNLGIALGLINSYMKNLVSKGYITVSAIPRKRYRYYLTAKGFREKTRLTYEHLRNFTNLYGVARKDFCLLFRNIAKSSAAKIAFCGVDEVAEIAYLSLKEVGLPLSAVLDIDRAGRDFFDYGVLSIDKVRDLDFDIIIITSFVKGDELKRRLAEHGVEEARILDIRDGVGLRGG